MPGRYPPSVFISSTCFDLKQVRENLRQFLEGLGLEPVLSEYLDFPVDPNSDAVKNCLATVRSRADIFVLIVGGRYGSTSREGKSITNLEYLEARAKGVPIYVFAMKSLLNLLPAWRTNPEADFKDYVDSPKVLEFLDQLQKPSEHWVFPFESAQDITSTLRTQFGFLFSESLELRRSVKKSGLEAQLSGLEGSSLLLALYRPALWDAKLFCQLMSDKLNEADKLRKSLNYGITMGNAWHFEDCNQTLSWINQRMVEFICMRDSVDKVVNVVLNDVSGRTTVKEKISIVKYVADTLGESYSRLIQWLLDLHRVKAKRQFDTALLQMDKHGWELLSGIESFHKKFDEMVDKAALDHGKPHEIENFHISLNLALSDPTELLREIEAIRTDAET